MALLWSWLRPGCEQPEALLGTGARLQLRCSRNGQQRPGLGAMLLAAAAVALGGVPELRAQPSPASPQGPPGAAGPFLTVRVTATPAVAAERLEEIRRAHKVTLIVTLRAEGWIPPVGPKGKDFIIEPNADLRATFRVEWNRDYSIGVAVSDPKIAPRWKPVRIHETRQTESIVIPFRELDVEARPDFGLYASHLPQKLRTVRGFIRDPQNFVARSGSDASRVRGRYFLETKGPHVRFFFWDVKLVHTLLTPVETGESTQTVVLAVDTDRREPYEVPRYRTGPFGEIWLQAFPLRESNP